VAAVMWSRATTAKLTIPSSLVRPQIFRRIIRAQQRRTAEKAWGAPPDSIGDLDGLLEHEEHTGTFPDEDGIFEEPPDDIDPDPEYLDYILSQHDRT
jgi:hypothetical protein